MVAMRGRGAVTRAAHPGVARSRGRSRGAWRDHEGDHEDDHEGDHEGDHESRGTVTRADDEGSEVPP